MQVGEANLTQALSGPVRVLAMGHSNLGALIRAGNKLRNEGRFPSSLKIDFMQLRDDRYNPHFPPGNTILIKPALRDDLQAKLEQTDIVVSCMGSNHHAAFGLVNHPRPYDFVLDPSEPLIEGREIVPASVVRTAMRDHLKGAFNFISAVRALIDKPIIHCQSPAPIASEAHIRQNPNVFAAQIEQHGVAPASFRLKLWRLQSEIYREFLKSMGVEFLPVPPETLDENGCLSSKAWRNDPTHGNTWYGERVILQLEAHIVSSAAQQEGHLTVVPDQIIRAKT